MNPPILFSPTVRQLCFRRFHSIFPAVSENGRNFQRPKVLFRFTASLYCSQYREIHQSIQLCTYRKRRHFVEEKILDKRSTKSVVYIYNGMSLRELSLAADVELDILSEILLNIAAEKAESFVDNPDNQMEMEMIISVVSALKMKPRRTTPPSNNKETLVKYEDLVPQPPPPPSECQRRPPVVTIMGHVDHGKTTLLDALRNSRIVAEEYGGITQHIGAFSVSLPQTKETVTFLDTPGHAAFKAMRQRGARSTDIVVLVVAADDGVMDQTVESINYARDADVPLIVAINKCDKSKADPQKTRRDLMAHEIIVEDMGGDTLVVEISALQATNLDKLQETILFQAEMMELESTSKGLVEGVIIESSTAHGLGKMCTLIINRGTLRKGSILVAGTCWGRVRSMHNEFNKEVTEAGPSCPVRISGWRDELPTPGEMAFEVETEEHAKGVVKLRSEKRADKKLMDEMNVIEKKREDHREDYMKRRVEKLAHGYTYGSTLYGRRIINREKEDPNAPPKFSLMVKCDVEGTLEAIRTMLESYNANEQVELDLVALGVGELTEPELELAKECNAIIYCFNLPISARTRESAAAKDVSIEQFNVIYKLVDTLKVTLNELLNKSRPKIERKLIGEGHVLLEYRVSDHGRQRQPVAGVRVDFGIIDKNHIFRFSRITGPGQQPVILHDGPIVSMQRNKALLNSATVNDEIAISLEDKSIRYKPDDQVETFEENVVEQKVEWYPPGF